MFSSLPEQAPDKILALMAAFRDDPREQKIDLGVGVYKDASGATPIMGAVKTAEKQLWEAESTKSYVALVGDLGFHDAMIDLVLADALPRERIAAAATPGGTGAVRQAFELAMIGSDTHRVCVPTPTWPNHLSILKHLKVEAVPYRYFDPASGGVNVDGMIADISAAKPGDVILLHGCCHNPTGANPTDGDWDKIIAAVAATGATAMVDIAYQGFGDGLDADASATRKIVATVPEVMIAASCSKNFGVYRERAGCLMCTAPDGDAAKKAQGTLAYLNRQNYSFPPDHGARLVTMVLGDPALRAVWETELEEMRVGMIALREALASELRRATNSDRFDFLARHRGMFSLLGVDSTTVERLRADHGVYIVPDSRMNIAGLNAETVPVLAEAIAASL